MSGFYSPVQTRAVGVTEAIRDRAIETLKLAFPSMEVAPQDLLWQAADALADEVATSELVTMEQLELVNDSWATQYAGVARDLATSAEATVTITAGDADGHTLPAGEPISIGGVLFALPVEAVIPAAATEVTDVEVLAVDPGAFGNVTGDATYEGALAWVDSVTVTTPPHGGSDDESITAFREKAARHQRVLGSAATEEELALLVSEVEGVGRVLVIRGYDPGPPESYVTENAAGIFIATSEGLPTSSGVKDDVEDLVQAQRLTNLLASVLDATYTEVDVDAEITTREGYDSEEVRVATAAAVTDFLDPANFPGAEHDDPTQFPNLSMIYRSDIEAVIKAVDGVLQVTDCQVGGADELALAGPAALTEPGTINVTLAP